MACPRPTSRRCRERDPCGRLAIDLGLGPSPQCDRELCAQQWDCQQRYTKRGHPCRPGRLPTRRRPSRLAFGSAVHGLAQTPHGGLMRHDATGMHVLKPAFDPLNDRQLSLHETRDSLAREVGSGTLRVLCQSAKLLLGLWRKPNGQGSTLGHAALLICVHHNTSKHTMPNSCSLILTDGSAGYSSPNGCRSRTRLLSRSSST